MAEASQVSIEYHRLPEPNYIDAIRWLPSLNPSILISTSSPSPSLQTLSLTPTPSLLSTFPSPSRITSLSLSSNLASFSTSSGSLYLVSLSSLSSFGPHSSIHVGPVSCLDLMENGSVCVSVGEDGRVNIVSSVAGGQMTCRRVWDSEGLVGYNAVKWCSPTEFVTGGLGFGLQWWDLRKPGGPTAQFQGNWPHKATSGVIHSIDIHPSRKHTCLAGGSAGTVFAWDLRWPHRPIVLCGVGLDEKLTHSPSESEVWKVQYDNYTNSLNMGNISSSRILPAMICSEDGILAVIEEGEEPYELLAEPCAINSFDINPENPSDVICSLEWESIAVVRRP